MYLIDSGKHRGASAKSVTQKGDEFSYYWNSVSMYCEFFYCFGMLTWPIEDTTVVISSRSSGHRAAQACRERAHTWTQKAAVDPAFVFRWFSYLSDHGFDGRLDSWLTPRHAHSVIFIFEWPGFWWPPWLWLTPCHVDMSSRGLQSLAISILWFRWTSPYRQKGRISRDTRTSLSSGVTRIR